MSSHISPTDQQRSEAQTMEGFALHDKGAFNFLYSSSRWGTVPFEPQYWTDSSVCLELWVPAGVHYGVCFAYGSLGVLADHDGDCGGGSHCTWEEVDNWGELSSVSEEPLSVTIAWAQDDDDRLVFDLWIADTVRATIPGVDYMPRELELRMRLNANVTDPIDGVPLAEDSETLRIDSVCVRSE